MRFYYQQGKTLIDQDLILAKGEYLMLQGHLEQAMKIFKDAAANMQLSLGLTSYKTLNFLWKMGEIQLSLGDIDGA